MTRDDERLLWIFGVLLLAWIVFRQAGFRFAAGVGPIGASFGIGTSGFTGFNGTMAGLPGGCSGCLPAAGPVTGDFGNYAQG